MIAINKLHSIAKERKIKMLTSYTSNIARFTQTIADILLVGDSLGMVLYNMPSTHGVTMEMMELHTKAVSSVTTQAIVIADMPFGSFEVSKEIAFQNACRLIIAGANGVKIEGGEEISDTITFLANRGIPVVGHIGLMPQKIHTIGSYSKITNTDTIKHFQSIQNAGASAIVMENIHDDITNQIAKQFPNALTIGIGAGTNCKGHVAVFEDLINLSTENTPPFSHPIFDVKAHTIHLMKDYFNNL
ncbi:MAG: 3-methyl-2-oxobutanoate hydroxymethyltransferase [Candidatus Deianiraeaceae bacterium]|jgi:3-methyl-2-oxobutanoate hydroxymethyltransferase